MARLQLISVQDFVDHLFNMFDVCILIKQLLDYILDCFFVCYSLISLVDHFSEEVPALFSSPYKLAHISFRSQVLLGDFILWPLPNQDIMYDVDFVIKRQR
jgi:hypothetical protein